jgi:RND family efflux transporter MFP subunit
MNIKRRTKWMQWAAASLAIAAVSPLTLAAEPFMPNGVTKPTQRVEMSVGVQGIVKEVLVKPGDSVKIGQVLVQLDDSVERKRLEAIEVEAKSDVQVRAAEAKLAKAQNDLQRKKSGDAFAASEIEDAQLEVKILEMSIELAKQEIVKKKAEMQVQEKNIERMKLVSYANGVVEKIDADPGEVADPSKPALVVVDNSKIDVEASLPTAQVNKLKLKDKVFVQYQDETEAKPAEIIFLAPVADAASETRLVRAQMLNTDNKPSGMAVVVKLSDKADTAVRAN